MVVERRFAVTVLPTPLQPLTQMAGTPLISSSSSMSSSTRTSSLGELAYP